MTRAATDVPVPFDGAEPNLVELEDRLQVSFGDRGLLRQALVHKSLTNEQERSGIESNERLEFLGDAVIGAVVADHLYRHLADRDEGQLTLFRSSLVRGSTLASWARALDLGSFVMVGRGEARGGGLERDPLLASAFEAVIGAVYLDKGFAKAVEVVGRFVRPEMDQRTDESVIDAKSRLQQLSQARFGVTPTYEVLDMSGLGHSPIFTVRVVAGGGIQATADGRSKQVAQQTAAADALGQIEAVVAADVTATAEQAVLDAEKALARVEQELIAAETASGERDGGDSTDAAGSTDH